MKYASLPVVSPKPAEWIVGLSDVSVASKWWTGDWINALPHRDALLATEGLKGPGNAERNLYATNSLGKTRCCKRGQPMLQAILSPT